MPGRTTPAKPKRHDRVFVFTEWAERLRAEKGITLLMPDGAEYVIDPPELWPDEITELALRRDVVGCAKAILGERYPAFVAAGGNARVLDAVIAEVNGTSVPE